MASRYPLRKRKDNREGMETAVEDSGTQADAPPGEDVAVDSSLSEADASRTPADLSAENQGPSIGEDLRESVSDGAAAADGSESGQSDSDGGPAWTPVKHNRRARSDGSVSPSHNMSQIGDFASANRFAGLDEIQLNVIDKAKDNLTNEQSEQLRKREHAQKKG